MKKLFNICLLCLLAIAAAAQTTHQLKVTWQPLGSITMYAHLTNSQGEYMSYSSEKLDAFTKELTEVTNGAAVIEDKGELHADFSSVTSK